MLIWKLKDVLDSRSVTRYALQKKSEVPMNTIRGIYDGQTSRVDFGVLERILTALEELTGKTYTVGDLLEWKK